MREVEKMVALEMSPEVREHFLKVRQALREQGDVPSVNVIEGEFARVDQLELSAPGVA